MSSRPRVTALQHEIERVKRLNRLLLDRVDVQARYIATLERKVAEMASGEPEADAETAKGAAE